MIGYWPVVIVLKVFFQGNGVMWNVQHRVQVVRKDLKHNVALQVRVGFKDTAQAHARKHTHHQHVRTAFCYFPGFLSPVRPKLGM